MKLDKKTIILIVILILILIATAFVVSSQEASYCCEKTTNGAWCQSSPPSTCDTTSINPSTGLKFRTVSTSCEATAYCKLGTCIDSLEGTCLPNVPQSVCQQDKGIWDQRSFDEIPQCQLGCCILGDQAAFVTQTACKRLSSDYNLETNFRSDIQDEISCIASASPDAKGACAYEQEFQKTCGRLCRT